MSGLKPPNKNGGKSSYHKMPAKSKQSSNSGGLKYGMPKKPKLPTPVLVTNILMVCVILAICGVVFAITYNNMQYDKAEGSNSQSSSAAVSTSVVGSSSNSSAPQSTAAQSTVASTVVSTAVSETVSGSAPTPTGEFEADYFTDALFIGDSIFTGLYSYSYIDRANVAASIGYTAYGAQVNPFDEAYYSGSAVDYAKSRNPKKIIIMLGTNTLSSDSDKEEYMDDFENGYRGLLNKLKKDCPDSKICAVSVPPITADSSMAEYSGVTNAIINNANARIKSLCGELDVIYYDLNSVLKDENGYFSEDYAEADGMHFLGTTYPILLSGVQKVLEQ